MQNLTDFAWEIAGTADGKRPAGLVSVSHIDLRPYDSGYTLELLKRAVKKDEQAPEDFRRNFSRIITEVDTSWKMYFVTIYSNRIAFEFCRDDWDKLYHFELKTPKMLGLRFFTYPSLSGRQVTRETSCLMWGDARTGSCRVQLEETQNGHLTAMLNLYHDGRPHKKVDTYAYIGSDSHPDIMGPMAP